MNYFDERDSNKGSNDAFEGYQKGTGAVLDHLVPINERVEDAPALLLQGERQCFLSISTMSKFIRKIYARYKRESC